MIVYESFDGYQFFNYVDKPGNLDTLYKITGIEYKKVEAPDLGNNFILIWSNGETQSSGNPFPGGLIYLQNDYIAIRYDRNSTSFKVIQSASYQYHECYEQIALTKHHSTAFGRSASLTPEEVIFTDDGTISVYPDLFYDGIVADYIAAKNGEVFGYFDIKAQTYFATQFPKNWEDKLELLAFFRFFKEKGTSGLYSYASDASGIVVNDVAKTLVDKIRDSMKEYKPLEFDFSILTGFSKPQSDAVRKPGCVVSCLNQDQTVLFLSNTNDAQVADKLIGLVCPSDCLLDIIKKGFKQSLVDVARDPFLPGGCLFLLNSDFQAILDKYNFLYFKFQALAAKAGIIKGKGELIELLNLIGSFGTGFVKTELAAVLGRVFGVSANDVKTDIEVRLTSSLYNILDKVDLDFNEEDASVVAEKAKELKAYLRDLMLEFSHDSNISDVLQSSGDSVDLNQLNYIKDTSGQYLYNKLRAICTVRGVLDVLRRNLESFDPRPKITYNVEFDKCRWCCIHHRDKLVVDALRDQSFFFSNVRLRQDGISLTFETRFNKVDSDIMRDPGKMTRFVNSAIRDALVSRYAGLQVINSCDGWINGTPYQGPSGCTSQFNEGKVAWSGKQAIKFFRYELFLPLNVVLSPIPLVSHDLVKPQAEVQIDVSAYQARAVLNANSVDTIIDRTAAKAAYDAVAPLLAGVKDSYQYQGIGCIGANYDGVMVPMKDLSKIAAIDEEYTTSLIAMIDALPDATLREALDGFRSQLSGCVAEWKTTKPIYYLSEQTVRQALPVSDNRVLAHYIYGGI